MLGCSRKAGRLASNGRQTLKTTVNHCNLQATKWITWCSNRFNPATVREYMLFPSSRWLYHIQYGEQLLSIVAMTSHDKPQLLAIVPHSELLSSLSAGTGWVIIFATGNKVELFIAQWTRDQITALLWAEYYCASLHCLTMILSLFSLAQRGALSTLPSCSTVTNTKCHLISVTQRALLRKAEHGSDCKKQRSSVNIGS